MAVPVFICTRTENFYIPLLGPFRVIQFVGGIEVFFPGDVKHNDKSNYRCANIKKALGLILGNGRSILPPRRLATDDNAEGILVATEAFWSYIQKRYAAILS